jgi:hypothetical protein
MPAPPPHISLITLSRDNPDELLKTVRSVCHQTLQPTTYVVVDSSTPNVAPRMRRIAEAGGAEYVWVEPEGIYPAMVASLDCVPRESWVWWINSSDWLAGTQSIHEVSRHLSSSNTPASWLVGQMIHRRNGDDSLHHSGSTGDQFIARLITGRTGLPHPSTVFWLPHLRDVSPYEDSLSVASDYSTALRFARMWGGPVMSPMTLSVHPHTGFSARHPLRNFVEKAGARWTLARGCEKALEPPRTILRAARAIITQVTRTLNATPPSTDRSFLLGGNGHFCGDSPEAPWPECCDRVLEKPFP